MAKKQTKKANGRQPSKKGKKSAKGPAQGRGTGLDADAVRFANLLRNPCGAPLAHPVYTGSEGGVLARYETDYVGYAGATGTAGFLVWTPGAFGVNGSTASHLLQMTSAASGTAAIVSEAPLSQAPGGLALPTVASSCRCVSACIQVYWPGTEQARQGYLMYGNINGRTVNAGETVSADALGVVCQYSTRMPGGMLEFKWRPADGDQMYIDVNSVTPSQEFARRNSLALVWKGMPVLTGIRIRQVCVYEYQPDVGQGVSAPITSRAMSNFSLDQVLNTLDKFPDWANSVSGFVGNVASLAGTVGAVAYGGRRRPAIMV